VGYGAHDSAAFDRHQPLHVARTPRELHAWLLAHG
jgi:hypothetical protein